MEQYQINLEEIENYKTQGTIIKSKEKNYLKWRKTNKVFFHTGKTKKNSKKTKKKHITCMQNGQGKLLTTNSNILKECKKYFQTLYTKHTHMRKLKIFFWKT